MTTADDALSNVLVNGILMDIHENWRRRSLRSTLILVYCGIDTMAYLTMPADKAKAGRSDFVAWTEKYMRFRDANQQTTLGLPGLELYAARCGLVHTYGSEADLHKDGTVKRQIGYGDEMLPEVQEHHEVENLVVVSVRGLVDSFSSGVAATLEHIKADVPSRALFTQRLQRMMQEVQFA